ncbi:MAG: hypothetical protein ACI959_001842 [Limisphaerales bacterium]|jgi:hypothetical protein
MLNRFYNRNKCGTMKELITFSVLGLFTLASIQVNAQNCGFNRHRPAFGISLGAKYSNVTLAGANAVASNDLGVHLGILMDYPINKWVSIVPRAELAFNGGSVLVSGVNDQSRYDLIPVSANGVIHVVVRKPEGRTRPYILFGTQYQFALSKDPISTTDFPSRDNITLDLGIGIDQLVGSRRGNFRFAPELRYSYGLININTNPQLSDVRYHDIALVLNFMM